MASDAQWYVFVEANSDHPSETTWELQEKHHVEGDRAAALSRAEEICRTWSPGYWELEDSGRRVFRASETGWFVEVTRERWDKERDRALTTSKFLRVTVAELVYAKEAPPAQPPEKKDGIMRRAFGSGRQ
ncbi:hypothetical protein [Streptomyces sp. NPDC060027]|uniref:hypothetical protein n=1 Tax=Streptomyces sp. NPDC060027 TaxID=3347040 RepID=UPI00367540F1